jgi:muramidase (phage lysozyme)
MSQKLLNYIGNLESPNGVYDVLVGGKRKDLRGMTINEVMAFQKTMKKSGHESTAVGRYQIIADTLGWVVKNSKNISGDDLFTDRVQDLAGMRLLERRGLSKYESGSMDYNTFAVNLAKEWASLPVPVDMVNGKGVKLKIGDSYHKGVGSNKAHGSPLLMANAIKPLSPDNGADLVGTTRTRPLPATVDTAGPASDDPLYKNKALYPLTPSFQRYLINEENPPLASAMERGIPLANVRYKDSNGTDKVGFGHKLTRAEQSNGYIDNWRIADATKENIIELFQNDQTKSWDIIKEVMKKEYGADIVKMDARRREMLLDVQFSQADGVKDEDLGPYVRAIVRGDFEAAHEAKDARYKTDPQGKKHIDVERVNASEAQFFGTEAARGNYIEESGQKEARAAAENIRKGRYEQGRQVYNAQSDTPVSPESVVDSKEGAAIREQVAQGPATTPATPNVAPGYAAGDAAAPAATPLVATPAPDIDLGGMLSKEYQSPTGQKGMLSTLPEGVGQATVTNERHTSV